MADDTMRRRREIARAAFIARRGELGLTQENIATSGVSVRTVVNFESQQKWPKPRTRAALERAVGWASGELERLAAGRERDDDLDRRISEIPPDVRRALADLLRSPDGARQALGLLAAEPSDANGSRRRVPP